MSNTSGAVRTRFSLTKIFLSSSSHSAFSPAEIGLILRWLDHRAEFGPYAAEAARLVEIVLHFTVVDGGCRYIADRHVDRFRAHIVKVSGEHGSRAPGSPGLLAMLDRADRRSITGPEVAEIKRGYLMRGVE